MKRMSASKYRTYPAVSLPDRKWPSQTITKAPRWCSVDLRDGNQALMVPMNIDQKREMFLLLADMGFREIEVGFPSASRTEYEFLRHLVNESLIPDSVTIQVLTQAREHLIKKTFDSLQGARRAVVHLYNSTSELQRRVVFRMDRKEIVDLALRGAELIRKEAESARETEFTFEYSPESFTGTEPDFAIEICEAVMNVWEPATGRTVILNLPATVEMATPNIYADQIEWFCRHLANRDSVIISTHAHNDRGTAVAATELALMAGADRVEGTLFGNGERTGNVDIVTLALNIFSQGIDPELDLHDINKIIDVYERCTGIPVHVRHPYAGELVYTAFSGSHQDAISKGMKAYDELKSPYWEVPYLPIDPSDVGRTYESIIRINSQSGKGGIAHIMERDYGFQLPKKMHPEFGTIIQGISDRTGGEIRPEMIWDAFDREYLQAITPFSFGSCPVREMTGESDTNSATHTSLKAFVYHNGVKTAVSGSGNGLIDAFSRAFQREFGIDFRVTDYHEHALEGGSDSRAAAYVRISTRSGMYFWGVGTDTSIEVASFRAILSAVNRSTAEKPRSA